MKTGALLANAAPVRSVAPLSPVAVSSSARHVCFVWPVGPASVPCPRSCPRLSALLPLGVSDTRARGGSVPTWREFRPGPQGVSGTAAGSHRAFEFLAKSSPLNRHCPCQQHTQSCNPTTINRHEGKYFWGAARVGSTADIATPRPGSPDNTYVTASMLSRCPRLSRYAPEHRKSDAVASGKRPRGV